MSLGIAALALLALAPACTSNAQYDRNQRAIDDQLATANASDLAQRPTPGNRR